MNLFLRSCRKIFHDFLVRNMQIFSLRCLCSYGLCIYYSHSTITKRKVTSPLGMVCQNLCLSLNFSHWSREIDGSELSLHHILPWISGKLLFESENVLMLRIQVNIWKFIYLNYGKWYEDMIVVHRSYAHNLSRCEIKAWRKLGLDWIQTYDLCDTGAVPCQLSQLGTDHFVSSCFFKL